MNEFFARKLLPCAHCGDDNVTIVRSIHGNEVFWRCECVSCGMRTADYADTRFDNRGSTDAYIDDIAVNTMKDAIDCCVYVWNRRASAGTVSKPDADESDESPDHLGMGKFKEMVDNLCDMVHAWGNSDGK